MRFRSSLREHLAFTRQETLAIAFLAVALLIGQAVRWYRSSAAPDVRATDYSALDSEFVARARDVSGSVARGGESPKAARAQPAPGSVDINTATAEQLIALPGIGPVTAEKIVAFRDENGPFETAEDLLQVRGIGEKKLARIRVYLHVD